MRHFLIALAVAALAGCNEECVDQFDCAKIASKSALTCQDGRCVVKTVLPSFPTFTSPDAGRTDAGVVMPAGDGGAPVGRLVPGDYQARLSGGQLVPPVTTTATGSATATLLVDDAGVSTLSWSLTYSNLTPTNLVLMLGAPAGRSVFSLIPLADAGVTSPVSGVTPLTRAQAESLSAARAAFVLTSAGQPLGELRGQVIPKGGFIGYTQFVRAAGGYGGGGQLVLETDGGFIPVAGSFDFDWRESGVVASAAVSQGGTGAPIFQLPVNAAGTGSAGTFDPLTLLFMLRDAGVYVTGSSADGGEVFRGDLSLSLR